MMMVGPYRIVAELGRGEVAVVYRAQSARDGRMVALKVVPLEEFTNRREREAQRERLFREARAAVILAHPSIAAVYDFGQQDQSVYVAMELVRGSTLAQLLSQARRPRREYVFSILRETAAALDYAHERGLVHRDIKPANIMIAEGGLTKVMDFGIAKINPPTATHENYRIGTPIYSATEQIQGQPLDGRADQYSLAVVAYEMLSGEPPTQASLLSAVGYRRVYGFGDDAGNALTRALAARPELRFRTCAAFVNALQGATVPAR